MIKKLIKITTALALVCSALVYVGCTKDNTQDVTDLQKQVSELTSRVTANEANIKTLQTGISSLEAVKTKLADLQKDLEKKADATALALVEAQILEIEESLDVIDEALSKKASISYVQNTFATIEALGQLEATVSNLSTSLLLLAGRVSDNETAIKDNETAIKLIDDALTSLKNAHEALKQNLECNYYNKTAIDNFFELYYKKGEVEGLILAAKSDLSDSLTVKAGALQEQIDQINKDLADLNQDLKDEAAARIKADDELAAADAILRALIDAKTSAEASARHDADSSLDAKFTNLNNLLGEKLEAETIARIAMDLTLQADYQALIAAETAARESAVGTLEDMDAKLGKSLDALKDLVEKYKGDLTKLINDEVALEKAARQAAEAEIIASIAAETAAREKGDSELSASINDNWAAFVKFKVDTNNAIDALKDQTNGNTSDIKANADMIAALEGRVSELEKKVAELTGTPEYIASLTTRMTAAEAAIKDLNDKVAANTSSINEHKAAIEQLKKDMEAANATIEQLKKDGTTATESIAANAAKIAQLADDLSKLQENFNEFKSEVEEKFGVIDGKLDALNARVTSIKACPSLTDEAAMISVGAYTNRVISADFSIVSNDSTAAKKIVAAYEKGDTLVSVYLQYGLTRDDSFVTKASVMESGKGTITNLSVVEGKKNTIRVVAVPKQAYKKTGKSDEIALFYSLSFKGSDDLGDYEVMSEFTSAIYGHSTKGNDLTNSLRFFKDGKPVVSHKDTLYTIDTVAYTYKEAETAKDTPFKGFELRADFSAWAKDQSFHTYSVVRKIFDVTKTYSVEEFVNRLGMPLELEYCFDSETPVKTVGKGSGFDTEIGFNAAPDNMFDYIADTTYSAVMWCKVNYEKQKWVLKKDYLITKITHKPEVLPTLTVHWNYQQCLTENRRDSIAPTVNTVWNEAVANKATVSVPFAGIDTSGTRVNAFDFYDPATNYYPSIVATLDKAFYEKSGCYKKEYSDSSYAVLENVTDIYKFVLPTVAEKIFTKDKTLDTKTIPGSITKSVTDTIKNFSKLYILTDTTDTKTVEPALVSGLPTDDYFADIQKHFKAGFDAGEYTVSVIYDGRTSPKEVYSYNYDSATDEFVVTFVPGAMSYEGNHTYQIQLTNVFGINNTDVSFSVKRSLTTDKAPFSLETTPYIVDGVGKVYGKVKGGKYKIDSLCYSNQVKLVCEEGFTFKDIYKYEDFGAGAKLYVRFVPVYEKTPGAIGLINDPTTSQYGCVPVDETTGILDGINEGYKPMTWGEYTGLNVDMKAYICVWNGSSMIQISDNSKPDASYKLSTSAPVRLTQKEMSVRKNRTSSEPVTFNVYEGLRAEGRNEGAWITGVNIMTGTTSGTYTNGDTRGLRTKYVYDDPTEAYLNSQEIKLVEGKDYSFNKETGMVTVKGDNLAGTLTFKIKGYLEYYLDYATVKDDQRFVVNVEIQQPQPQN